jgi:thioredoxin reductase (NADPH)
MPHLHHKLIILGSGPAGYTAAIYAARAMLSPVVIQGIQPGGQLTITTDVENFPGFAKVIQGPWLMDEMRAQAEHVGTTIIMDHIAKVDLSHRPFRLEGDSGDSYSCDSLIICTGAQARWLGITSEEHFKGFGVSACATCDGFFYKGRHVVVVGGGNTAMEEALFLTKFASKVSLVHRRDEFRGERILRDRVAKNLQIEVIWNSAIAEVLGTEKPKSVTGVRLASTVGAPDRTVACDGIFIAIGHAPATELFKGQLAMTGSNYLITKPDSTATSVAGVYAAGDVKDETFRQAVTAAGMGCMAALEAEKFLAGHATIAHAAE